ncbi:hypothetical protein SORBI_3001G412900 [Sorghum bicolor]|uniref:Uncharacterized protein n=2 Tax=Sorghum bicolor TaxID=4558 RepID=A0A1Z5SA61_SORBI|nr:hypothetical protein SORBI_3001G412900 [Sorghum bicolor]
MGKNKPVLFLGSEISLFIWIHFLFNAICNGVPVHVHVEMAATAPTNKNARMEVLPLVLPPRRRRLPVAASTLLSRGGSAPSTRFGAHGHGTTSPLRVQMNGGSRRMDGKKRAVNQGRATHFRFTTISPCTWQNSTSIVKEKICSSSSSY